MELQDVGKVLVAAKLAARDFPFLVPDAKRYSLLLLQPNGNIVAQEDGVRHADAGLAQAKFLSYLKYASDHKVDIAVTPEYSCPWSVLTEAIAQRILPSENSLWILGCEATSVNALKKFQSDMKGSAVVLSKDLEQLLAEKTEGFVDPVCYLFHALNAQNKSQLVVLVQLKTKPMGGHPYELDRLAVGRTVYVFRNRSEHTIKLLTLLCSDVLGWDDASCNEVRDFFVNPNSILLFHLQLNKEARHALYRRYRTTFLTSQTEREVVCLNWARNVIESEPQLGKSNAWNNDAVSALYARPWKESLMDEGALEAEEGKGIYFSYASELKSFLGVLNFSEFCFELTSSKVNQRGAAEAAHRICRPPQLTAVQEWDLKKADWQHAKFPLAAEYQEGMKDRGIDISKLGMLPSSPLRFEKLAALSSGGLKDVRDGPARWPRFVSVDALNMDSSESIRRVSFAQDRSVGATQFRAQRYSDFARVVQLVSSGKHFRPTMSIFVESNLEFDDGHPFCNLLSKHGRRGTAIFLGDPSLRVAEDMYTRVINQSLATYASKGVREAFPLPEELVIWQVPDAHGGARVFPPYKAPEFTENPAERPAQVNSTAQ